MPQTGERSPIKPGSNEEVSSAAMKITETEASLINRYCINALPAIALICDRFGSPGSGEKPLTELHRDALTYFAAAFTSMDGYNLRRTLGKQLDLLVDAIVDDNAFLVIPRHLLGSNASTSLEFCGILLDYLVGHMDQLNSSLSDDVVFYDEEEDAPLGNGRAVEDILFAREQRPVQGPDFLERRRTTLLQLFERILKSLSTYSDNESVIRKHLKFLVSSCLKLTMEKPGDEPDNYCMLLRYLFRSISAGKFEESYKELLPLIPTVLNGLYRIICSGKSSALRSTAIELCLTIPARLSSLLPHMNLLIRVIIPALDSDIGELINLGLRTLEFWVDNLNPLFLYPELSKQIDLFSTLMQALSRHLRPAPYPYGLLTLRLLGKLGGKNRQFLRYPMELNSRSSPFPARTIECSWRGGKIVKAESNKIRLPLPVESSVTMLKRILTNVEASKARAGPRSTLETEGEKKMTEVVKSTLDDQLVACFNIILAARKLQRNSQATDPQIILGLLYGSMVPRFKTQAFNQLAEIMVVKRNIMHFATSLSSFVASSLSAVLDVGVQVVNTMLSSFSEGERFDVFDLLVDALCDVCCLEAGSGNIGPQRLILLLVKSLGPQWAEQHQFRIVNASLLPIKSIPRELTHVSISVTRLFLEVCTALYGRNYIASAGHGILKEQGTRFKHWAEKGETESSVQDPSDAVFRLIVKEVASPHQLTRFATRFLLRTIASSSTEQAVYELAKRHSELIRQVLFSKSLRFLPLPQQVGLLEGLCVMLSLFPKNIPLEDQHLLACLSELLKMSSVADKDMEDTKLEGRTVDKDGYIGGIDGHRPGLHSFSIFYRRSCMVSVSEVMLVIPQELPPPVQLRVSAVKLLHIVINAHENSFFRSREFNIHCLFFRSLVSRPIGAVNAAHEALRDILAMNSNTRGENTEELKVQPRLPKELLQNCIRPVLLNLKDHTRLSVPLLRGLSRLLALLSSWFNKTLGEKLLDHLQQWADPQRIMSRKIWEEGEEPLVAAAIVGIFASLPQSSHFVEHLVKTCINLEAKMHLFKAAKFVESPFRRPLALYLNKHPQHAVSFFFPRLKTPMYNELFQHIVGLPEESQELRRFLCNRQRTQSILNVCYERPLAILRSEKSLTAGNSARNILALYGVQDGDIARIPDDQRPMDVEALELQQQGFRMVRTLLAMNSSYFADHFELVRAFRFLWNSRGRLLRIQYEDMVSPRFQEESKLLARFLISYASNAMDDIEILFELSRSFLQPSAADFEFVSTYLRTRMTHVPLKGRDEILRLFFDFMSKESADELKVLGIQHMVRPMLEAHELGESRRLEAVQKFMTTALFKDGKPIQCGERLRVELLQIANILLRRYTNEMASFAKQLMKYCWGLLKSEDSIGKSWSFLVICRLISCSDTPSHTIIQTYQSLLKSHQQEGKDLIQSSIGLLIPSMTTQLSEEDVLFCVKDTNQLLHNDGNTNPQVAHVLKTIVDFPEFFKAYRAEFTHSIFVVLPRLNYSQTSPTENKILAAETVSLLLDWNSQGEQYTAEQCSVVANFVIRFWLSMSDTNIENKAKELGTISVLEKMFGEVLQEIFSRWNPSVKHYQFEKLMSPEVKNSNPFIAALKILTIIAKHGTTSLHGESSVVRDILSHGIDSFWNDEALRDCVRDFGAVGKSSRELSHILIAALEKEVDKVLRKLIEEAPQKRHGDVTSVRGSDRQSVAEGSDLDQCKSALVMLAEFSREKRCNFEILLPSLLAFAKSISKAHLLDASARQRHGASVTRASSTGIRHHTPTAGIIDLGLTQTSYSRPDKHNQRSSFVSFLVIILDIFAAHPVNYIISTYRKELLQLSTGVMDSSDDAQLIIAAIRIVGKFLLVNHGNSSPLTGKERNGMLMRLATLDFCNVVDDASLQLVTTFVFDLVQQLRTQSITRSDEAFQRLTTSCVLNARVSERAKALNDFFGNEEFQLDVSTPTNKVMELLWRVLLSDYEGIGGRFWIVLFVEALLQEIDGLDTDLMQSYRILAHANPNECLNIAKCLVESAWKTRLSHSERLRLGAAIEVLLSRTYHFQFIRGGHDPSKNRSCINNVRAVLNLVLALDPLPVLNTNLVTSLAENYNCWHECLMYFESVYAALVDDKMKSNVSCAIMHCYRQLGEMDLWQTWAKQECLLPKSKKALSCDTYGLVLQASAEFAALMEATEEQTSTASLHPSDFEMDMWEEKWLCLQRELCQFQVVSEFANLSQEPRLQLECAWKNQDWDKVRTLTSSAALFSAVESGDPSLKLSETLLAVADGRLSDVENLHAQTAQLCLYRWQLLPLLATNSPSHSTLLHFFHRLVEIRESGQIMVETNKHASKRTLPDLKNLLNAWRHRLPNDWEGLSRWDEIFSWRSHMFNAISSNFNWCDPDKLAVLHDRPWTLVRLAKTARKQGLRDTSILLLSQNASADERALSVPDAFLKLREQILVYYNAESKMERHGGLNLINISNLSFFDESQRSELFRLKAVFLQSLQRRSKANQAFSNAVQICPTHSRAWLTWGEWYVSLGSAAEKQHLEQNPITDPNDDAAKDVAKKVRQYLSQAIGCFLEATKIDSNEWARMHLPGCLWMLTKDGIHGSLCQTFEKRATLLPSWMWLPWIPQLLTSLYRRECIAAKSILMRLAKDYPQAVYYPLRVFYLERRDIDRARLSVASTSQTQGSVFHAEELVTALRRSHACLWSYLEPILEELIVKFRPSNEEDLLATVAALVERAELHFGSPDKREQEKDVLISIWKTLAKIAQKYFKPSDAGKTETLKDSRAMKSAAFKDRYKMQFETDFCLLSFESGSGVSKEAGPPIDLSQMVERLRVWKTKLELNLSALSPILSLSTESAPLAMFGVGDAPDLWPFSCDPQISDFSTQKCDPLYDLHPSSQSTTSSSAAAALKAASSAAITVASAARLEGVGGSYGGGSSFIEVPGQYAPSTSQTDTRPSPELHVKVLRFSPHVAVDTKSDVNVRRVISMEGSDGKTYHFHLGFAFSHLTRTDERTAQTHFVLDKVLRRNNHSSRAELSVQSQPVVPVAQRLRLVSEPEDRLSLADACRKALSLDATGLQHKFVDDVRSLFSGSTASGSNDTGIEQTKRLEVFRRIKTTVKTTMLLEYMIDLCDSPEFLFQFRRVFAQQWAINCLLQYAFSASDRTPNKVVMDTSTGRVLAPEFRISYNHQGCFETAPVPFRLTDNLTRFLGQTMLDGKFVKAFATASEAAHSCRHTTDSVYRLLIRDDLVSYLTKGSAKPDIKTVEIENQLLPSVGRNVASLHGRFAECAPSFQQKSSAGEDDQVVDQTVRDLVASAGLDEKQCMMPANFHGWI